MYKPNILIVGPSGSGKSSCLRNLPSEETYILDLERKGMPFKTKFPHLHAVEKLSDLTAKLAEARDNPKIKFIVIDSFTKFCENQLMYCRAAYKGYDIYTNYNAAIRRTIDLLKHEQKIMIVTAIDEFVDIQSPEGSKATARRVAVSGKEWEGKVEKEFLAVFFTDVRKNPQTNNFEYKLLTNTDGICSAKTPMDMFKDRLIPNDLNTVVQAIEAYYK
jgi:hypothetical protein